MTKAKKPLSAGEVSELLVTLEARFHKNGNRHKGVTWETVATKLKKSQAALRTLAQMEQTGGEPDVVVFDKKSKDIVFVDCAPESPSGRRSLCFDEAAHKARKENKPESTAEKMAGEIGIELLNESEYRALQKLGAFDLKTSSWIQTPASVRKLGGALFCDRRYDTVFVYHNGADSYYAARGFRGLIRVQRWSGVCSNLVY